MSEQLLPRTCPNLRTLPGQIQSVWETHLIHEYLSEFFIFSTPLPGQMQEEKLYLSSSSQHRVTISRPCLSGYRLDFMQSSSSPQLATISSPCLAGYLKNAISLYLVSLFWHLLAGHAQGSAVLGCSSRRQLMLGRAGGFSEKSRFSLFA